MKYFLIIPMLLSFSATAAADSISGGAWTVIFNLPDQTYSTTSDPEEWAIRDALLDRINALQNGHQAALATYTFSAGTTAGLILNAISAALARGASVSFVTDPYVDTAALFDGTNSLAILAARPVNPLVLVQDDSSDYPVMHHKLGLFDYGGTNRQVFAASWNFTTAAGSAQWNIALLAQNPLLYSIYTNEMRELLAGRFHDHSTKSHAHDGMTFRLDPGDEESWVRFAPYPESYGGNNAARDITNAIAQAQEQIVFTLNKLTLSSIAQQLIAAADRGVRIHGVMPRSDTDPGEDSRSIYTNLLYAPNYATTNRVHMLTAYSKEDYSALDSGESDLIHSKYMVIDPFGENPMLIHGSANWTATALVYTNGNDENVMFIRNAKAARAFYAHFKRVTGAFMNEGDFWCEISSPQSVEFWTTDTNRFVLETAASPSLPWASWKTNDGGRIGMQLFTNSPPDGVKIFRARRL
ncbi:MAG TPA: phospholipase D-like domain-containing protein [Kiritimatiellia bacterium]|nr:phospholipase D-like domain-containing protein [Kiritimatiellia bacterium]